MSVEVVDEFLRSDESNLDGTGWTSNGMALLDNRITPNSSIYAPAPPTTDVTYGFAWAFLSGDDRTPLNANQEARAVVYSAIQNVDSIQVNTLLIAGSIGTFVLDSAHGRTVGTLGLVDLGGFSGYTPAIDQQWVCQFTDTAELTIDFGESIAESGPILGAVFSFDAFARIILRLDDSVAGTTYQPLAGYGLRLAYEAASVRKLYLDKIDKTNGGWVNLTSATVTTSTTKVSSTDLNVIQDIRLTISDEEDGSVKLRGYLNQQIDTSPDIEFSDQGYGSATYYPIHKDPGYFGIEIGAQGVACEFVRFVDDWDYPVSDSWRGRTLSQLRTELTYELSRGGFDDLADELKNYWLRKAHDSLRNHLGDLALFLRRESTFTLTFDNSRVARIPDSVDSVLKIMETSTRVSLEFSLQDYDPQRGLTVFVPSGPGGGTQTYRIRYTVKISQITGDTDRSWCPRQYDEALVLLATLMASTKNANKGWVDMIRERLSMAMRGIRTDMNRLKRSENAGFHVRRGHGRRLRSLRRYAPDGNIDNLYGRW